MYGHSTAYGHSTNSSARPGLRPSTWMTPFDRTQSMGRTGSTYAHSKAGFGNHVSAVEPFGNESTIKPSEYHSMDIATNAFTDFVGGQSGVHQGNIGGKRVGPLTQYAQNMNSGTFSIALARIHPVCALCLMFSGCITLRNVMQRTRRPSLRRK